MTIELFWKTLVRAPDGAGGGDGGDDTAPGSGGDDTVAAGGGDDTRAAKVVTPAPNGGKTNG